MSNRKYPAPPAGTESSAPTITKVRIGGWIKNVVTKNKERENRKKDFQPWQPKVSKDTENTNHSQNTTSEN